MAPRDATLGRGLCFMGEAGVQESRSLIRGGGGDAEREGREHLDLLAGEEAQAEAAGDGREEEHGLHRGEVVADAEARAAAEGEVGVTWDARDGLFAPALGAEGRRVFEPAR